MKFGLTEDTITKINSVFENHPEVEQVIIYGSRAKGTYREGSDIDITLKGNELSYTLLSKINQEIDDLNTPYLFDISIFDKLNSPDLEEQIGRVGLVFYDKN
ncbi:MAG: nucleotidyltransferase domain-containing protein [Flavobacteriia bacterium]|nr:nucleotidyltransferase domain-containing protein [Flavobacteriia bacterium]